MLMVYPFILLNILNTLLGTPSFLQNPSSTAQHYCMHEAKFPIHTIFYFLAMPHSMWNLSSRPGIEPMAPEVEAWSLNHWTPKEVPHYP